jgi:hypothetical protein
MRHTNILAAIVLLPAFGCVTDEEFVEGDTDDPELASTTQALSGTSISYHECDQPYGLPCLLELGSAANNRACFIGGIYGKLGAGGGVQIFPVGNTYFLNLYGRNAANIAAKVICVSGGTNRTLMTWTPGQPYDTVAATSNRRCFLSSISGHDDTAFNDTTDYVHTWKNGSTWYLGGQISGGAQPQVSAVCIDTPYGTGLWGGIANLGSTVGWDIGDNASGGWACGFTKLGGKFMSNSYGDKIEIDYNGSTKIWSWTLVNGKQAEAHCVK